LVSVRDASSLTSAEAAVVRARSQLRRVPTGAGAYLPAGTRPAPPTDGPQGQDDGAEHDDDDEDQLGAGWIDTAPSRTGRRRRPRRPSGATVPVAMND